jgi:hypothetical protein
MWGTLPKPRSQVPGFSVTVPERPTRTMSGVVPARRLLRLSISVDLKSQIATSRAGLRHGPALAVWAVWLVALGLVVVGIATTLPTTTDAESIVTGLSGSVAAVSLATVGAILVTRLPRNRIGWLLWASGVLLGFSFAMTGPLVAGLPGAVWLLWLVNLTWLPPIVFVGVLLPLAYPTGHLPSPRWRSVVVIVVMAMTLTLI